VLGIPAIITPISLEKYVITRDYAVMLGLSILLFLFAYGFKGQGRVNRLEGAGLLTGYIAYLAYLYINTIHP
jgi:cation:H+ antiporter